MEGDAVARISEEFSAAVHGPEDAVFAFFAQAVLLDGEMIGDDANRTLRKMSIKIVEDNPPTGLGRCADEQVVEEAREVSFLAPVADLSADFA